MNIGQTINKSASFTKTILCVIDEETQNAPVYRRLVAAQLSSLRRLGAELVLLHVAGRAEDLPPEFKNLDAELLVDTPIEGESGNERSRKLAQRAVKYGKQARYDVVIGFGWTLSRGVAGGQALANKFWAFVDDATNEVDRSAWTNVDVIDALYMGTRKVFVFSEERRSILENTSNAANGRTYLPALYSFIEGASDSSSSVALARETTVVLPGLIQPALYIDQLSELSELAKSGRSTYRFVFEGAQETWNDLQNNPNTAVAAAIPDLICVDQYRTSTADLILGLVPDSVGEKWISKYLIAEYLRNGIVPIAMERFLDIDAEDGSFAISPAVELAHLDIDTGALTAVNALLGASISDTLGGQRDSELSTEKKKIVLAGADFKFAGDLVELLNESSEFDLRIDLWANNSHPNPAKSAPFVDWADIVICEFSSFNAIWYSQNKREGQKLIVRLHGYELLQPWIDQLEIANVDQVVFVSEFYRRKAIETKGWDEAKTSVVSNTVDFGDLSRDKFDDAKFHLGMAGYVPILKRPDRALDLLEELLKSDDRFVLHMRGHEPWNYQWEWKKVAHQSAYRDFYARIAGNENLRTHISFEDFGPDMAGWFRKIGWMLSPSYRETFHLAPVEGMASGALPVVWERDGAVEIFPEDYVVSDVQQAAQLILSTVADQSGFQSRAFDAKEYATRYSRSFVKSEWIKLIHSCAESKFEIQSINHGSDSSLELLIEQHESNDTATSLLNVVSEAWRVRDYATAISLLDANIKLTANDTGELKQWEHWVRGVFQTAMSLESLLLESAAGCVYEPQPKIAVQIVNDLVSGNLLNDQISGFEVKTIGMKLPLPGLETEQMVEESSQLLTDFDFLVKYDGSLRSNYYLAQAASEIASFFRDTAASVAVASGGLLESLATLLAARRVGIPFVWAPTTSRLASDFVSVFDEIRNDDPVHEIYQAVLQNSDALIGSEDQNLVLASLKRKVPLQRTLSIESLAAHTKSDNQDSSNESSRLTIAYAGDGSSVAAFAAVADVTLCTSENVLSVLDAAPDAFVLEYAGDSSVTEEFLKSAQLVDPKNLKKIQNLILHSRVMGARSIFISKSDPDTLAQGKEIARKCDVLVSSDRKSLVSYMRLNPNSVQVAVNVTSGKRPSLEPQIVLDAIMNVDECITSNEYGEALERGLAECRPVVPGWRDDKRWSDSGQIGAHDDSLRFEASGKKVDGVAAMWENCYELSQGRTAIDFAVYVLRSAGFPVTHPRGLNSDVFLNESAGRVSNSPAALPFTVVSDGQVNLDDSLKRDVISLYRISGSTEISIRGLGEQAQEIEFLTANGRRVVASRGMNPDTTSRTVPAKISDFSSAGVSIIIATYMGAGRLPRLLSSVLEQRLPLPLMELVVVPNGPDDGTTSLLEDWGRQHPEIALKVLPLDQAGVAKARNHGLANASKEFVTFADDDDYLERNFLMSLYARAESNTVVLGKLSDVDEETDEIVRDTATSRRVIELSGRLLPLAQRAGALGMNGAKLLPTWLVRECVYDSSLRSGEDVAFMAQLLIKPGVFVTSAADVDDADYMRVMRFNSISRRDETFEFMVIERLDVMKLLLRTRKQSEYKGGKGAIEYLVTGQLGFIKRFIRESSSIIDYERTLDAIDQRDMRSEKILQPLVATLLSVIENPDSVSDGKRISLLQQS